MTKVKICGLKNPTDIKCINTLSPDFAGFVMFLRKAIGIFLSKRRRNCSLCLTKI